MSSELTITTKRQGRSEKFNVAATNGSPLYADTIRLAESAERAKFAAKVHELAPGINAADVESVLLERATAEVTKSEKIESSAPPTPDPAALLAAMPEQVRVEAAAMLRNRDLLKMTLADIHAMGVAGEKTLAAAVYMVGVSRRLPHPLALIAQGQSSSGKSYVIEKTVELFPPEAVIHAKQITPQALFHMKPGSLEHQFIVAGERSRIEGDEAAEATRALREMLSSGVLSKLVPEKQPDGSIVTKQIVQKGPIAYIESTTLTRIFDEDANRCIMLSPDETEAQTRNVLAVEAARRQGLAKRDTAAIIKKHHAMQRMIRPMKVLNPFAEKLADLFPAQRVEARRAFGHLLNMVEASALLHQCQRQENGDGHLVASIEDYQIAKYLLDSPMARLLGKRVSDAARRFLDRLANAFPGPQTFSTRDACAKEHASDRAVRGWLSELAAAGYLDVVDSARGKITTWKLTDTPPTDEGLAALPGVEVLQ